MHTYTDNSELAPSAAEISKGRRIHTGSAHCVYWIISSIQIILYAMLLYEENPWATIVEGVLKEVIPKFISLAAPGYKKIWKDL